MANETPRDRGKGELPHTDLPPRRLPYYDDDELEAPSPRGAEPAGEPGQVSGGKPPEAQDPG